MQVWESDQVCLVVFGYREDGVSNLLDVDCSGEGGLLGIVSLEVDTMFFIVDMVGRYRRMVTIEYLLDILTFQRTRNHKPDLLRNQLRRPSSIHPLPKEQLSQKGIQRFFLISKLLTATSILLFQRTKEPLQYQQSALLRIGFVSWRDENRRVFRPVRGEFHEGGGGQDEWRGSQGREIA